MQRNARQCRHLGLRDVYPDELRRIYRMLLEYHIGYLHERIEHVNNTGLDDGHRRLQLQYGHADSLRELWGMLLGQCAKRLQRNSYQRQGTDRLL